MRNLLWFGGVVTLASGLAWGLRLLPVHVADAGPITENYRETQSDFTLTIKAGGFSTDETHNNILGTNWRMSYNISEDAGWINDVLSISGTAFHVVGPHGEGQNPLLFNFGWTVNADDYPQGAHVLNANRTLAHVEHKDIFRASLTFTVSTTGFLDDIVSYNLLVTGCHAISECGGGGIAEPIVLGADSAAETSAPESSRDYTAPVAAVAAGAVIALVAGGWYVRRRWLR